MDAYSKPGCDATMAGRFWIFDQLAQLVTPIGNLVCILHLTQACQATVFQFAN